MHRKKEHLTRTRLLHRITSSFHSQLLSLLPIQHGKNMAVTIAIIGRCFPVLETSENTNIRSSFMILLFPFFSLFSSSSLSALSHTLVRYYYHIRSFDITIIYTRWQYHYSLFTRFSRSLILPQTRSRALVLPLLSLFSDLVRQSISLLLISFPSLLVRSADLSILHHDNTPFSFLRFSAKYSLFR